MRTWVTLFSQTGSEIYNLSNKLKRSPDIILTNSKNINPDLVEKYGDKIVYLPSKPTVEEYKNNIPEGAFVTLHGWLRIIPAEVCEKYEIYNSHPANLQHCPWLKGKDPQMATISQQLTHSGNTIHKCTAELDNGEIMSHSYFYVYGLNLNDLIKTLHVDACDLWYKFIKKHLQ